MYSSPITLPSFLLRQSYKNVPLYRAIRALIGIVICSVTLFAQEDWGDAPDSYHTLQASNGARHTISNLYLGKRVDNDVNGQPTPLSDGDNYDGPASDDDGVTFLNPLVAGSTVSLKLEVTGSGGVINAWCDFANDGSWLQVSDQIFNNVTVVNGSNTLSFTVPPNIANGSTVSVRFRLSTASNLNFDGAAINGEVEDYSVELQSVHSNSGTIRIVEIMAGLNGDSKAQFIELELATSAPLNWANGNARIEFYDRAGKKTGRYFFPSNAPTTTSKVLLATQAFQAATGLTPDFIIPVEIIPIAGKMAFKTATQSSVVSYGGNEYTGMTDSFGVPAVAQLPILNKQSIAIRSEIPIGEQRNIDYTIGEASPTNASGAMVSLSNDSLAVQGGRIFNNETFLGNGRTCASCHVPGEQQFGIDAQKIASLATNDPLFISELHLRELTLSNASMPSDLRGIISDGTHSVTVLSGTENKYFVYGAAALPGTITDSQGNSGLVITNPVATALVGPTASNGSLRGLEDPLFLHSSEALFLENIDGFTAKEVLRSSPHLLNVKHTAPYGLSGDFPDLKSFSKNALIQHMTRSLNRISGRDFREMTDDEAAALESFQQTITNIPSQDFNIDRFLSTEKQLQGKDLFFGNEMNCAKCHNGPTLAHSDGSIAGSIAGVSENFNIGTANISEFRALHPTLPTEPAGDPNGVSTRLFNTPSLIGLKLTAPYFHNSSAKTLSEAVTFYNSTTFNQSPASAQIGGITGFADPLNAEKLTAFLEALTEIPVSFTKEKNFSAVTIGQGTNIQTISLTNTSNNFIELQSIRFTGESQSEFALVTSFTPQTLAAGETKNFDIVFNPLFAGLKSARFEITGNDTTSRLGIFEFGTLLNAQAFSTLLPTVPAIVDFGGRNQNITNPRIFVSITNPSATEFLRVRNVALSGANVSSFSLSNTLNDMFIPPLGFVNTRVTYSTAQLGVHTATLIVSPEHQTNQTVVIPLIGRTGLPVTSLSLSTIPSSVIDNYVNVRLEAIANDGSTAYGFNNSVTFSSGVSVVAKDTGGADVTLTNGVWENGIAFRAAGTGLSLQAVSGAPAALSVSSNPFNVTARPMSAWLAENFSLSEINNSAISGLAADADGDGFNTYAEYIFNLNPKAKNGNAIQSSNVLANNGSATEMRMLFLRRNDIGNVGLQYEKSIDLSNWNAAVPSSTQAINSNILFYDQVSVSFGVTSAEKKAFFRLRLDPPVGDLR